GALAQRQGIDVIHVHLLDAGDLRRLSAAGVPVAVIAHNARPGWPAGFESLGAQDAALLIACAAAVEDELRDAALPVPVRTIRNAVDPRSVEATPARRA